MMDVSMQPCIHLFVWMRGDVIRFSEKMQQTIRGIREGLGTMTALAGISYSPRQEVPYDHVHIPHAR